MLIKSSFYANLSKIYEKFGFVEWHSGGSLRTNPQRNFRGFLTLWPFSTVSFLLGKFLTLFFQFFCFIFRLFLSVIVVIVLYFASFSCSTFWSQSWLYKLYHVLSCYPFVSFLVSSIWERQISNGLIPCSKVWFLMMGLIIFLLILQLTGMVCHLCPQTTYLWQ